MDGVKPRIVVGPDGVGVLPNYICEGRLLTFRAPRTLSPGEGFLVGHVFAVATQSAVFDGAVEGMIQGVFFLPKLIGETWTNGVPVYWNEASRRVTTMSRTPPANNKFIGFGLNRATAGEEVGVVLIGIAGSDSFGPAVIAEAPL